MFHTIISIISSVPFLIISAFSVVLGMFIVWLRSDTFRFTRFAYKRPWVFGNDHSGEFQKLVKETTDSEIGPDGLVSAERTLCDTFKSTISGSDKAEVTEEQFNRAKDYLKISEQNAITPASIWAKVGLFLLILAESVGTGYVLAPWMSTEITASQANVAAAVLALAVAIILAMLTHLTGTELSKYFRYKRCSGSEGEFNKIDLSDEQMEDAFYIDPNSHVITKNPAKRRFSNRVSDPGSVGFPLLIVSIIIILGLMFAIFAIRLGGIDSEATKQNILMSNNGISARDDGANPFANTTDTTAPPDVVAAQKKSRAVVADTLSRDYKEQGVSASIMLSLIYFVTQFVAFMIAFKTAFIEKGEAAFKFTHNEPTFQTFYAKYIKSKIDQVESLLTELRRERAKSGHRGGNNNATFKSYLEKGAQREKDNRIKSIEESANNIACAQTPEDRTLQWGLAVKNLGLSSDEQNVLEQKYNEAAERRKRLQQGDVSSPPVLTSTVSVAASGDDMNYASAAESIMALPEGDRGNAMKAWLTKNNEKMHKDGLMEAIAQYKANKAMQVDDEMLALLKD